MKPYVWPFIRRFVFLFLVSAVLVMGFSEIAYRIMRSPTSRGPKTIELVVPNGTAERVAKGEAVPTIPDEMVFVTGDILVVKNEDVKDHQLGPLFIPAGKSATLPMNEASNYSYTCSFNPTNYLGINVQAPVGLTERLGALEYGTPSTAMFLLVYSFVVKPLKPDHPKKKVESVKVVE